MTKKVSFRARPKAKSRNLWVCFWEQVSGSAVMPGPPPCHSELFRARGGPTKTGNDNGRQETAFSRCGGKGGIYAALVQPVSNGRCKGGIYPARFHIRLDRTNIRAPLFLSHWTRAKWPDVIGSLADGRVEESIRLASLAQGQAWPVIRRKSVLSF